MTHIVHFIGFVVPVLARNRIRDICHCFSVLRSTTFLFPVQQHLGQKNHNENYKTSTGNTNYKRRLFVPAFSLRIQGNWDPLSGRSRQQGCLAFLGCYKTGQNVNKDARKG